MKNVIGNLKQWNKCSWDVNTVVYFGKDRFSVKIISRNECIARYVLKYNNSIDYFYFYDRKNFR